MKQQKTADELKRLFSEALRRRPECDGLIVGDVRAIDIAGAPTWEAECHPAPGNKISPDCKRVMISAMHSLQQYYDLAG